MKRNIKTGIVCLMLAAISLSSCKKYLNVNTNPNVAQTATLKSLLPGGQLLMAGAVGDELEIYGSFWAQYWTQSPGASQFHVLDQYVPGPDNFTTPWGNLYAAEENFFQVYKLADSQKSKRYMAIALLMQAYTFQVITDGWGDVPFKQALKGQFADSNVTNPKFDSQLVVYNGIIAYIDSANVLLTATADPTPPGSDDLVYGGDMAKWKKFSNTLMLKVLLRMSQISPAKAQAGIAALYAKSPQFIGLGDDAFIAYGFNTANQNPLYADEVGLNYTQNLVGSSTCIDSMNNNNDPRLNVFYEPTASGTTFVGTAQGYYQSVPVSGTYSIPSIYVGGDAQDDASGKAPVNLLTSYESLFLQAEVSLRGWANPGQDSALFMQAVAANFNYYNTQFTAATGVSGATALANYIAAGGYWITYPGSTGTFAQNLSHIITQKWFAMCGNQGFEAWCEWRRTGYPNFLPYSKSTIIGNNFPKRFLYPSTETTTNTSFPGQPALTKNVWWETL